MIQFFTALDFDNGVDSNGTDDGDYGDDHHDDATDDDDDDDDDDISFSGSYQVSGWAVNGRELAATTTNPSSYMIFTSSSFKHDFYVIIRISLLHDFYMILLHHHQDHPLT